MTEEKEEEKKEPAPQPENTGELTTISKAKEVVERMEEANKKAEMHLKKMEALYVEQTLGGTASVGVGKKEKTKEDEEIEDARALLKGTGYEDILD